MSELPTKNGKAPLSERSKYEQATLQPGDVLTIPTSVADHIQKLNLVCKWVSKHKIASNGGRHPSGWIPYELNADQKQAIGGYGMGVINGECLERGDMVLAVKPIEAHEAHAKLLRDKISRQIDTYENLEDAKGKKILDRGKKPV